MTSSGSELGFIGTMFILLSLPTAVGAEEPLCERPWPVGEVVGEISDEVIDESSGLSDSWLHDDRLWTHNDSGDEPRLWAMQKDATVTTEVHLIGAENVDYEDMAIAPCGADDDRPCIYLADFGDNLSRREEVVIYRFPEPDLGDDPPPTLEVTEIETLVYRYADGPRDAEALLVHPQTRQIWVIEKTGEPIVEVFSIPEIFDQEEPHIVESVATLEIPGNIALTRMVTAGDIAPDGSEFTFRTYLHLYTHCVPDLDDFETAFSTPATQRSMNPATLQGEALTYDRGDGALWLTSENLPAPLIRMPPRDEDDDENAGSGGDSEVDSTTHGDDSSDPDDAGIGSDVDPESSNIHDQPSGCACSLAGGPVNKESLIPFVLFMSALVIARHRKT